MHGSGNDFVIINSLVQNVRISATMARRIADRRLGVGCDQLLFIQPPLNSETDFDLNFYNHDGSEAEQCGNGARCAAHYVFKEKLTGNRQIKMQTMSAVVHLKLNDDKSVTADMGKPIFNPKKIPFIAHEKSMLYQIDIEGTILDISVLSMGNPHAVITVNNTDNAEVEKIGKILQKHLAGLAIISSRIISKEHEPNNAFLKTPIFISHGGRDAVLPISNYNESIEVLKNYNYNYENYLIEKDEHTMSQETITLFQNFIKKNI